MSTSDPPLRLFASYFDHFAGSPPTHVVQAPAREMWAVASQRSSSRYTLVVPDLQGEVSVTLDSARRRLTVLNRPLPGWARLPVAVMLRLGDDGVCLPGADIAAAGEEPIGPRYTYSLALAVAAVWQTLANKTYNAGQLAALVERSRRDYMAG